MKFTPIGNQGCRLWWGEADDLLDRKVQDYGGEWLMGINGPRSSRYDLQFVAWCAARRMMCIRTVDLFWAFEYHRKGFPRKVSLRRLRTRWENERARRLRFASGMLKSDWRPTDRKMLVLPRTTPRKVAIERLSPEARSHLDRQHPDPGTWDAYSAEQVRYFESERSRYEQALTFWRSLPPKHRQTFLRCAAYSNRRPESHPDYLAACPQTTNFAFVEVKGPDDYLRPSQKRFFPELVGHAGQEIWVARSSGDGSRFAFHRFEGEALIRHETLFGKPIELHRPVDAALR